MSLRLLVLLLAGLAAPQAIRAGGAPQIAKHGMVVSQSEIASQVGSQILQQGGNAVDAAVATALALAVTHPAAGNIGGGGFLVFRSASGEAVAYDFREKAPAAAHANMWQDETGEYDRKKHHSSYLAVGVPGSVAGLHLAWSEQGHLPWKQLVEPAIQLARDGFPVSYELADSLKSAESRFRISQAAIEQFTSQGKPFQSGDLLIQSDLADTLQRIADQGPAGFYAGKTAELIVQDMQQHGGLITQEDLSNYQAVRRDPVRGRYRDYEIISMPPPSSGGITLIAMLNLLEEYPLRKYGPGSADSLHLMSEAMRIAYRNRALYIGDPDFNPEMPVERLISKSFAETLRSSISMNQASKSAVTDLQQLSESSETTHLSVVDKDRNAVALTTTLEYSYGSGIVVKGAGFLLNNEMGDFNPVAGLTTEEGLIGTKPNLTAPGKRMLSSMCPTIVAHGDELLMVTGSPGGRTIINTVLQTILNVIDHQMNAQEAVDFGRIHHQWLPDRIQYERFEFSPDTIRELKRRGHTLNRSGQQGSAHVILVNQEEHLLEAGVDRRRPDSGAAGY